MEERERERERERGGGVRWVDQWKYGVGDRARMVDGSFGGSKKEREEKDRDWWGYMKVHLSDCCSYIDTSLLL